MPPIFIERLMQPTVYQIECLHIERLLHLKFVFSPNIFMVAAIKIVIFLEIEEEKTSHVNGHCFLSPSKFNLQKYVRSSSPRWWKKTEDYFLQLPIITYICIDLNKRNLRKSKETSVIKLRTSFGGLLIMFLHWEWLFVPVCSQMNLLFGKVLFVW